MWDQQPRAAMEYPSTEYPLKYSVYKIPISFYKTVACSLSDKQVKLFTYHSGEVCYLRWYIEWYIVLYH